MAATYSDYLRTQGFKLTEPRRILFAYLQAHDRASTAELVRVLSPTMDRASIYRTLATLRQLDVVREIISGGHKLVELTDRFDRHHHHLLCRSCGTTVTFREPAIERRLNEVAIRYGIVPESHQIEVVGLCAACQATPIEPASSGQSR